MAAADQGGGNNNNNIIMRDYRKGNWTVGETMVLIEAKKMDDERRMMMKRTTTVSGGGEMASSSKPAELRWKWVEDYCWRKGCLRSQNQCNDKWDNLMRDFKKVREYERRSINNNNEVLIRSYWNMEKNERKEKKLPTNMLPDVYEALVQVVKKKSTVVAVSDGGGGSGGGLAPTNTTGYLMSSRSVQVASSLPNLLPPQQILAVPIPAGVLPLPPPPPPQPQMEAQPPPAVIPCSPTVASSDSDTSEYSDTTKRRRKGHGNGGEGTSGGHGGAYSGAGGSSSHDELFGSAISKSASIIAGALQASEEREERRHRDVITMHKRRLMIEESKTEISRQGINGLVDAINKLANSILALASNKNNNINANAPPPS